MGLFSKLWRSRREPDPAEAEARLDELLGVLLDGGDTGTVLQALDENLEALLARGRGREVDQLIARVDGDLSPDVWSAPDRLAQLAGLHYRLPGDRATRCRRALELWEQALEGHRQAGTSEGQGTILGRLGQVHVELGVTDPEEYRRAIPLLEEALARLENGEVASRAALRRSLGDAYAGLSEPGPDHLELAREQFGQALSLCEQAGATFEQAGVEARLGDVHLQLMALHGPELLAPALGHYSRAAALYARGQRPLEAASCHERAAAAHLSVSAGPDEHLAAAMQAYGQALAAYDDSGHAVEAARVRTRLAAGHLAGPDAGNPEVMQVALDHYLTAMRTFEERGMESERALVLRGLARIYLSPGASPQDVDQGVRLLEEAADYYSGANLSAEYQAVHEQLRRARGLRARSTPP
ncbi:MAG: hypothetical protein AB1505_22580 [Candidatus Latescibacterota bacterium]